MRPILELPDEAIRQAALSCNNLRYLLQYERDALLEVMNALPEYKKGYDRECLRLQASRLDSLISAVDKIEKFACGLEHTPDTDVSVKYAMDEDGVLYYPEKVRSPG